MSKLKAAIGTLIIAISTVQLANGFFGTFISLRVTREAFGEPFEGLVLSAYFVGFAAGAARCRKIVERIGHIRAFAAFGGLIAAVTAIMPLIVYPKITHKSCTIAFCKSIRS